MACATGSPSGSTGRPSTAASRSRFEDGLVIELYIIAQYGTRISEVAHNLMSAVKYEVERTLGLDVIAVNVNVQGIHLEEGDDRR